MDIYEHIGKNFTYYKALQVILSSHNLDGISSGLFRKPRPEPPSTPLRSAQGQGFDRLRINSAGGFSRAVDGSLYSQVRNHLGMAWF